MTNRIIHSVLALCAACALSAGCGSMKKDEAKDDDFHTSGSREADQRAEQRVTRDQQLRGKGGTGGEAATAPLFDRLGGSEGISRIVDDFVDRALSDPRVNWERRGVRSGGLLGIGGKSETWVAGEGEVARLKKHMGQFLALATGGPATYDGRDLKEVHAGMEITNSEFDATIGDLKATLDGLGIPMSEQKELLAVLESTRPQIAEER